MTISFDLNLLFGDADSVETDGVKLDRLNYRIKALLWLTSINVANNSAISEEQREQMQLFIDEIES